MSILAKITSWFFKPTLKEEFHLMLEQEMEEVTPPEPEVIVHVEEPAPKPKRPRKPRKPKE